MSYIFPGAIPYNAQATGTTPKGNAMWIPTTSQHGAFVDANKFERLYISYKGNGNYAIIGVIGDRDILINSYPTASDAMQHLTDLINQLGVL